MSQERRADDRRKSKERRGSVARQQTVSSQKGFSTLIILTLLSTLALIAFLVYQNGPEHAVNWSKLLFIQNKPVQEFDMGGIELGMNPEMVEKKHPNIDLTDLVRGEKIGTFKENGAKYTVWFVALNGAEKAYRIRYDQVLKGQTETDILENIGRRHGKPGTSDCAKGSSNQRKCHFQWWPSGGIALDVISMTEKRAGQPVTGVSMIATDTYLDGKRIRNQDQP